LPFREYVDGFGNICSRFTFPAGETTVTADAVVRDSGLPDEIVPDAVEHAVEDLPDECLVFLIGSRYCETDRMMNTAWQLFGNVPPGWGRVRAIFDYLHEHVSVWYPDAPA